MNLPIAAEQSINFLISSETILFYGIASNYKIYKSKA